MTLPSIEVGGWTITALSDGTFRLDGGSMFGVVPKALWGKTVEADAQNRIELALRPFLVEGPDGRALIEGGVGSLWDARAREVYEFRQPPTLEGCLEELGVAPSDLETVVLTHLHWDHCGACVVGDPGSGGLRAAFPNARHVVPEAEVRACLDPSGPRRASYDPEHARVLSEEGVLEPFAEETCEVLPGLTVHRLGGHSPGSSVVTVAGRGGATAVYWGDVLPMAPHVQPSWIMAFDEDVPRSYEVRSSWIARAADEGWLGLLYHDPIHPWGRIARDGERYAFEPAA